MIEVIEITGEQYDVDDVTKKYVTKKIGRLDRYLPRHARKSVSAEVKLRQINADHGNKYEVEVILLVPDKTLVATDSTGNMLAAVDIAEAKIISQLHRYKETTLAHIGQRGVLSRFKRSYMRENQ
jgi:putative sigma-54 modulation protein